MSYIPPILLFVNPKSGGKVGQEIINITCTYTNLHIVKLPEQAIEWTHFDESLLKDPNLRIIAAGGDGSLNWVLSMLVDYYGPKSEFKPPLALLPIGTGNDMSRTIGWGGYFGSWDLKKLPQFIDTVRNHPVIKDLDVWLKVHKRTDIPNAEEDKKYMVNYFSIGSDAKVAYDFEVCRQSCPGCFCCRCMSKTIYGPMAIVSCCGGYTCLKDYVRGKYTECHHPTNQASTDHIISTSEKEFEFSTFAKSLVFHNIYSRYCGKDTWHDYDNRPRNFYDGMVEVSTCAGFWAQTALQIGINTFRNIARINSSEFTTSEPVAYEVDGEAYMVNGPAKFTLSHYCTYPILVVKEKVEQ